MNNLYKNKKYVNYFVIIKKILFFRNKLLILKIKPNNIIVIINYLFINVGSKNNI